MKTDSYWLPIVCLSAHISTVDIEGRAARGWERVLQKDLVLGHIGHGRRRRAGCRMLCVFEKSWKSFSLRHFVDTVVSAASTAAVVITTHFVVVVVAFSLSSLFLPSLCRRWCWPIWSSLLLPPSFVVVVASLSFCRRCCCSFFVIVVVAFFCRRCWCPLCRRRCALSFSSMLL